MAGPEFDSMKDLLENFDCSICVKFMYPPIYQPNLVPGDWRCPNGHILCSICKLCVQGRCPTCCREMGDIRASALEKMGALLHFPCKYSMSGCSQELKYDLKQKHEEECSCRPYNCPFPCSPPCVVTGDAETLVTHLRTDHGSEFKEGQEIDTLFTHPNPCDGENTSLNFVVYSCHVGNFCFHMEAFHSPLDMIYMAFPTFVGDEISAMDYRYNLEIGADTHKLIWQGVSRSIRERVDQIRESYDGLSIHRSLAQTFAVVNTTDMLTLRVRGFVYRES